MKKSWNKLLGNEKGQALAIVLGLLALGSLTVTTGVNYATTSLRNSNIARENMGGVYAASAGVEYALWSLREGIPVAAQTPENINGLSVDIVVEELGVYTVYLDSLIAPDEGAHYDWIDVSGNITPVGGTTSNLTISIVRGEEANGNIRLTELGVVLPLNYTYDSVDSFPDNLAPYNPDDSGTTTGGAQWLKWLWNTGQGPLITGNHTQGFYIDGAGSTSGSYAWVVAQSQDVGTIGEITGNLDKITAIASRPEDGKTIAKIVVETITIAGKTYIFSWQISK